jgi:hypothetical protein
VSKTLEDRGPRTRGRRGDKRREVLPAITEAIGCETNLKCLEYNCGL